MEKNDHMGSMKTEGTLQNLSDFENKSLIIVDDDNPFRERLARAMEKKGFEVIQAEDNTNTVYREYLERNPQGGLQHLGFWTNNISDQISMFEESESGFLVRQRYGNRHVYLDEVDCPGVMIQLMARDEKIEQLFKE